MLKRLFLLGAIILASQSQLALSASATYYFYGTCSDCVLQGNPLGTLVLNDYVEGTPIGLENFGSFDYVGSNIVFPITVIPLDVYDIGGSIGSAPNTPYDFFIDYIDGLRFESSANGDWYICSIGVNGFYSGACDFVTNNDYGTGSWGAVPIPAAAWLFGSALLGLSGVARRKKA